MSCLSLWLCSVCCWMLPWQWCHLSGVPTLNHDLPVVLKSQRLLASVYLWQWWSSSTISPQGHVQLARPHWRACPSLNDHGECHHMSHHWIRPGLHCWRCCAFGLALMLDEPSRSVLPASPVIVVDVRKCRFVCWGRQGFVTHPTVRHHQYPFQYAGAFRSFNRSVTSS